MNRGYRGRPEFGGFGGRGFRGGNRGGNRGYFNQRGHYNKGPNQGPRIPHPNMKREAPKEPNVKTETQPPKVVKKEIPAVVQETKTNGNTPKLQTKIQQPPVKPETPEPKPAVKPPPQQTPVPKQTPPRQTPPRQPQQSQQQPPQRQTTPNQRNVETNQNRQRQHMQSDQNRQQFSGQNQQQQQHQQNMDIDDGNVPKKEEIPGLILPEREERKFTGRCRLFVGNLPTDTTEEEFQRIFQKYGEINEVFINKQRWFGFIRLDTRINTELAKQELDGASFKGRIIRVRVAAHGAALKVKNLSPVVSNELLEEAFSNFGDVERAVVIVDERGKPTGEGIVEFARKSAALQAIQKIKQGVFLLTASTRPITVEPLEQRNEEDGLPEKNVTKNNQYHNEREAPPRFAHGSSFEFEWGQRWKQLAAEEDVKREELENEFKANRSKMMEEIELARHDYHTEQMRQELLHRQEELKRLEEQRKEIEQRRENLRQRDDRMVGMGMQGGMPGVMRTPGGMDEAAMRGRGGAAGGENMRAMQQQGDLARRESEQFIAGGGSGNRGGSGLPPPPLPPPLLMDGTSKGMMTSTPTSFKSRFDSPAGGFEGANRGNLRGVAPAAGGGNFEGAGAGNTRQLMDAGDRGDRQDGFPPKRMRRN